MSVDQQTQTNSAAAPAPSTAIAVVEPPKQELIPFEKLTYEQLEKWAKVFFASGMFEDLKNYAAAMVKMKAGQELRIEPFASINGIFIIKGKTMVGAKLQASIVNRSPYFYYECRELSREKCVLEFYGLSRVSGQWRSIGVSDFTMQDAIDAGLADDPKAQPRQLPASTGGSRYNEKPAGAGQNGSMYRKYAKNMLFARAMTNGVSWFCPEVLNGNSGAVGIVNDFDAEEIVRDNGQGQAIIPDRKPTAVAQAEQSERYEPDGSPAIHQAQTTAPKTKPAVDNTDNTGAIDAEAEDVVEFTPIELRRKEAMELAIQKFGEDLEGFEEFLNGRKIAMLSPDALESLIGQLETL